MTDQFKFFVQQLRDVGDALRSTNFNRGREIHQLADDIERAATQDGHDHDHVDAELWALETAKLITSDLPEQAAIQKILARRLRAIGQPDTERERFEAWWRTFVLNGQHWHGVAWARRDAETCSAPATQDSTPSGQSMWNIDGVKDSCWQAWQGAAPAAITPKAMSEIFAKSVNNTDKDHPHLYDHRIAADLVNAFLRETRKTYGAL